MAEYYTTISKKQVKVLECVAGKKIHMSQSMIAYLNALAEQGSSLARDPSVEDFRKTISQCVGDALRLRYNGSLEDYKKVELEIERAFRQICAIKTNKYLRKVKAELDSKPAPISSNKK